MSTINPKALAIVQNHGYHPAIQQSQRQKHADIRSLFMFTSLALSQMLPQGRHLSLALTKLEEAEMMANRAAALEGGPARVDELEDDALEIAYQAVFRENPDEVSRGDMIARLNAALAGN